MLANAVNQEITRMVPSSPRCFDAHARALQAEGISRLEQLIDPSKAADIKEYLLDKPCFDTHVARLKEASLTVGEAAACLPHAAHRLEDVLLAPGVIDLATDPELISIAHSYLGCVPTVYSINAFWSFPAGGAIVPGLQAYHRDFDDFKFCTLFMFLTDTSFGDGAHLYARRTHLWTECSARVARQGEGPDVSLQRICLEDLFRPAYTDGISDMMVERLFRDLVEAVSGVAGTAIIEDGYGFHKGVVPLKPRLLLWVRYGLYENVGWHDTLQPRVKREVSAGRIPDEPIHRYMLRLLVEY
jgi:hypothetical protein